LLDRNSDIRGGGVGGIKMEVARGNLPPNSGRATSLWPEPAPALGARGSGEVVGFAAAEEGVSGADIGEDGRGQRGVRAAVRGGEKDGSRRSVVLSLSPLFSLWGSGEKDVG